MNQTLQLVLNVEFFQLEEIEHAEALARKENGVIYTWKTVGKSNWLEHGPRQVDALGLVVIPATLPDVIDMPDDSDEDDEEIDSHNNTVMP